MSIHLSPEQIDSYRRDGFLCPIPVMSPVDANHHRTSLENVQASHPELMEGVAAQKLHLVTSWMADIIRTPTILDAVESLIGPNLLCWSSTLFVKPPDGKAFVSWHQDGNYWGLDNPEVATAWLALTPATSKNGCMRMIPGSHEWEASAHIETFANDNLLSRGQVMAREIDDAAAVDLILAPGEISLHHVNVAHASEPNRSTESRIGIAIRYISPRVRQNRGNTDSATLVRGTDSIGNFQHEERPSRDFAPDAMAQLARVVECRVSSVYQDMPK
ncbi:MAG: phytanoyl-CoA dioxygenase [Alphaproteobacteria bacterium]|nr:phytanoyl-CoA dioxygenase [Alphaproteobacteria bacterium]HCP01643.1 phytanoyl-CoA dioxygenase [Rhodospirillaceae bacterium]